MNYEARYQGKDPLVTKKVYKVKPELENEIVSYASRAEGNRTPKSHLDIVKDQVDELRQLKPQANDLCNDLELLPESSYTSYSEWMKIIFAIANTSEIYYPIALWFSQKCPDKYSEQSVKQLWDQAIQQRYDSSIKNPVTHATIKYLAKKNNPERFLQTNSQNALRKLSDWVWKYNGSIDHYNIAKILYMTFSSKFKVDIDEAGKDSHGISLLCQVIAWNKVKFGNGDRGKSLLNSMNISLKDLNTFVIKSKRISESALMKPKMKRKARN